MLVLVGAQAGLSWYTLLKKREAYRRVRRVRFWKARFPGGTTMRFEITLRVTTPDGELRESGVIVLNKGHDRHEDTGLSIAEAKALLKALQQKIIEAQAEAFCASKSVCSACGRRLRRKGSCSIRYRTVFGDIPVTSPRYYQCACDDRRPKTFSSLTTCFRTTRHRNCCGWQPDGPRWSRSAPRLIFSRMSCPSTSA